MPSCVGRCCWLLIALFLSLCFFLCVSQFLAHWDGLLTSTCTDVVVIGATNRLHDIDAAALRRFARQFEVPLPDLQGRQAILTCLLAKENLGASVNLAQIAAQTPSFSGADLKELCRYACHLPMRELMVHSSAPTSPLPASSPAQPASAGRGSGPLASGSSPSQPSAAAEQPAPAPSVSLASGSAFSARYSLPRQVVLRPLQHDDFVAARAAIQSTATRRLSAVTGQVLRQVGEQGLGRDAAD